MIWTSHPFVHRRHSRCAEETREATASLRRSVEQQQRLYQLLGNGVTKGWAFQGELNNCLLWGSQISRTLWPWKDGNGNQSDGMVRDAITTVSYLFAANYTPEQKWTPMVLLQKLMHERFRPKKTHVPTFHPFSTVPTKKTTPTPRPQPLLGFVNILVFFTMNPQDGGHRLSTEVGWSHETKEWSFSLSDGSSTWIHATPSVLSDLEFSKSGGLGLWGDGWPWMAMEFLVGFFF